MPGSFLCGRERVRKGTRSRPAGPPMTLGNMRQQGVHHLIAFCLNDACRHQALIDVSSYPPETPVPWFRTKVRWRQVRRSEPPHRCAAQLEEPPGMPDSWEARAAWERVKFTNRLNF